MDVAHKRLGIDTTILTHHDTLGGDEEQVA